MSPSPWLPRLVAGMAAMIVLAVVVVALLMHFSSGSAAIGGPFHLVDQRGRAVSDTDFRGRLMLVYFGYTFCPDVCPTALNVMSEAYERLPQNEKHQIALVFVTVDPERDDPARLADYVLNFSSDLIGLTGSRPQIDQAIKNYKVYAAKGPGEGEAYAMDHSSIIYLMGRDGRFLADFSHQSDPSVIATAIKKAL